MDSDGEPRTVRLRVDLSYDGSAFSGWAAQPGRRTVEDVLAAALGRVLRLPSSPKLTVAGRTDAGVHARGQVVHLDVPAAAWSGTADRTGRVLAPQITIYPWQLLALPKSRCEAKKRLPELFGHDGGCNVGSVKRIQLQ